MKTVINDFGDGKTLVVYTEEINLFKRLSVWESCQAVEQYRQYLVSSPWRMYVLAYDLYFPKGMGGELQRACEITNNLKLGRDPEPHKIVDAMRLPKLGADEKLMRKIIVVFMFDCDSKTAHEVTQKLGGIASEETIRKALECLSQPNMPLERHIEKDNHTRYSLRFNYEKGLPSIPGFHIRSHGEKPEIGTTTETGDPLGDRLDSLSSFNNIIAYVDDGLLPRERTLF